MTAVKIHIVVWVVTLWNCAVYWVIASIPEEHNTPVFKVEDTGNVLSKMLVTMYQTTWCLNPENLLLVSWTLEDESIGSFPTLGTDHSMLCHITQKWSPEPHLHGDLKIHILNVFFTE